MTELVVDLEGIRQNTAAVKAMLAPLGIDLVAVTKACLGEPAVAGAMLEGGAVALADTRDANLRRLRAAHPRVELHRIYLPSLTRPFETGDVCYVSSVEGARAVGAQLLPGGRCRIMVLVEGGDLREGALESDVVELAAAVSADPRLELVGVATNYACFEGGPAGIEASLQAAASAARALAEAGWPVARVSGGNSSVLALVRAGASLPVEVTELRCGEALFLGHDALLFGRLPGCRSDACTVRAEVLEGYTKTARGFTAHRLVLGVGHQDIGWGSVQFALAGVRDLGRSSDYLVVGVDPEGPALAPGDTVEMVPSYLALAAAWTSPFVEVTLV